MFNKEGQLKKWVVVVFTLLLPLVFSIWGIYLSKASYELSIETSKNSDQIKALTDMVKELRVQNTLLQQSISIQDSQFKAYTGEIKYTKRPNLKAEFWGGGEIGEISNVGVKITNSGGDISNIVITPISKVIIDRESLPKYRVIASGGVYILNLKNLRTGDGIRLTFNDGLMNRYSQDLIWTLEGENFQFGILKEIKK